MTTQFGRVGAVVAAVMLVAGTGWAQTPEIEPAVAHTATDRTLQWSACPPLLPVGCGQAVLHGDPGKPNADIFLKLPAKSVVPEHWHTSAERMVLVLGELHVTYAGQPTSVLRPGSYAYGPARRSHRATCASSTPCILFIAYESPVDAVPSDAK
jgi:quercetin dioxygenase-like cupin family protein